MPKTATGVLKLENGRYFIQTGRTRQEIPAGALDENALKTAVDQKVELTYSKPVSFIVAIKPVESRIRFPGWICYVPPPDPWGTLVGLPDDLKARKVLVERFVKQGLIDEVAGETLIR